MPDLSEILPDLFGIEVNTVVKDRMTAEKMPSLPFAFHDIIRQYGGKLEGYGADLSIFFDKEKINEAKMLDKKSREEDNSQKRKPDLKSIFPPSLLLEKPNDRRFDFEDVTNGWISFEIIRLISRYLMQADTAAWTHEKIDHIILERIRRS